MTQLRLRTDQLDWRVVKGEIVALDLRTSRYLSVNDSGTVLWERLADGATREELVETLQETYDIDEVTAGFDVDDFLTTLTGRDLIDDD